MPPILIYAKLQSFAVNILAEGFHAAREFVWICHQFPVTVTFVSHPSIIENKVRIARVAHAGLNHCVGNPSYLLLVDVSLESVPTIPSHWWSTGQFVLINVDIRSLLIHAKVDIGSSMLRNLSFWRT